MCEVRKFGLLSYEEVEKLKTVLDYMEAEWGLTPIMFHLIEELKAELELRG